MGAPGYYILCPDGHVIGMIEDDLYWGEPDDESSVWNELKELENLRCNTCNKLAKYSFCHYGDINDCLDYDNRIVWNRFEHRYIIPKHHKGNLILRSSPIYRKAPKSVLDDEEIINIKYDYLIVSKDICGFHIILDNKDYETVIRLKEEVAKELRDKLNTLIPK